ncbi:MAG: hypothetical protein ABI688_09305 [Bacteroidota bacterium]
MPKDNFPLVIVIDEVSKPITHDGIVNTILLFPMIQENKASSLLALYIPD